MICLLFYYVSLHPVRKKSDNLYTLYSSERCGSGHIFQNFSDLLANFCQEEMRYFRLTPPDMRLRPGVTVMT